MPRCQRNPATGRLRRNAVKGRMIAAGNPCCCTGSAGIITCACIGGNYPVTMLATIAGMSWPVACCMGYTVKTYTPNGTVALSYVGSRVVGGYLECVWKSDLYGSYDVELSELNGFPDCAGALAQTWSGQWVAEAIVGYDPSGIGGPLWMDLFVQPAGSPPPLTDFGFDAEMLTPQDCGVTTAYINPFCGPVCGGANAPCGTFTLTT